MALKRNDRPRLLDRCQLSVQRLKIQPGRIETAIALLFKVWRRRFEVSCPRDIFDLTFGKSDRERELSVISWVLPISEDTRKGNRKEQKYPSMLWSHTRYFGEPFFHPSPVMSKLPDSVTGDDNFLKS